MKGKRVVYGLIAGTMLFVIVGRRPPILSSLAWAQQTPKTYTGTLRVVVINRPSSCGGFRELNCPKGDNMMTSVIIRNQIVKRFPAAGCGNVPPDAMGRMSHSRYAVEIILV